MCNDVGRTLSEFSPELFLGVGGPREECWQAREDERGREPPVIRISLGPRSTWNPQVLNVHSRQGRRLCGKVHPKTGCRSRDRCRGPLPLWPTLSRPDAALEAQPGSGFPFCLPPCLVPPPLAPSGTLLGGCRTPPVRPSCPSKQGIPKAAAPDRPPQPPFGLPLPPRRKDFGYPCPRRGPSQISRHLHQLHASAPRCGTAMLHHGPD